MKTSHVPPSPSGHTAEITPIGNGPRRESKAVAPKAKPQPITSCDYGSGWYHDAAIQHLKEIH